MNNTVVSNVWSKITGSINKKTSDNYNSMGGLVNTNNVDNIDEWNKIQTAIATGAISDSMAISLSEKFITSKLREEELLKSIKSEKELDANSVMSKIMQLRSLIDHAQYDLDIPECTSLDIEFIDECMKSLESNIMLNKRDLIILNRLYIEYNNCDKGIHITQPPCLTMIDYNNYNKYNTPGINITHPSLLTTTAMTKSQVETLQKLAGLSL
jgi:hypothetical protein